MIYLDGGNNNCKMIYRHNRFVTLVGRFQHTSVGPTGGAGHLSFTPVINTMIRGTVCGGGVYVNSSHQQHMIHNPSMYLH